MTMTQQQRNPGQTNPGDDDSQGQLDQLDQQDPLPEDEEEEEEEDEEE